MNIQDVCEGKYLQLGALVAELNAYYDEGSNCQEMNIQEVCEGDYFAAGIVLLDVATYQF